MIPNSVTSIDFGAFSGCSSFTGIMIPNSVTSIDLGGVLRLQQFHKYNDTEQRKRCIGTPYKICLEDAGLRNARLSFRQIEENHNECLVKKWLPEEDRLLYERLAHTINKESVTGYFYGHKNKAAEIMGNAAFLNGENRSLFLQGSKTDQGDQDKWEYLIYLRNRISTPV